MKLALYLGLKFIGYAGWCMLGVRLFDREHRNRAELGVMWGALRLLIGLMAGLAVRVASYRMSYHHLHSLAIYFAIFVPLTALEWLVVDVLLRRERFTWRDAAWIAGGVVISLAADLAIVHLRSIPIDRVIA